MRLPASTPVLVAVTGLVVAPLAFFSPAQANTAGSDLVINEVYGGGGNSGATWKNDFVELYNPTSTDLLASGLTLTYYSAAGNSGGSHTLTAGTVPAHGSFLVKEAAGSGGTTDLPDPDASGGLSMSGTAGSVSLTRGSAVVDLVGYGASATRREGTPAPGLSNTTSASRSAAGTDTDDNGADFTAGAPSPKGSGSGGGTEPPSTPDVTIAQIQGTGAASPLAGRTVRTRGVVTASYPTGGFFGYTLQTPGADSTPGASDGLYVYQPSGAVAARPGQHLEVTGKVSEFGGLTELVVASEDATVLPDAHDPVVARTDYPTSESGREAHESELLDVSGQRFTVSDNFSINNFAEVGLATGDTPLVTPTETTDAQDEAGITAAEAANRARAVTLDDGASINFLGADANKDVPLPWLATDNPVRIGSPATFHEPVVLDYRNDTWKFQPSHRVTDQGSDVVSFGDTRAADAAPQDVGGDLTLATFNVLNYFNTTGEDWVSGGGACTFFDDRDGNHVTDRDCGPTGPRGAAEADDLVRQRDKIVTAINTLGADIVSLEEIENSVALGISDRDDALESLVDALNADAGTTRWAYAPSPGPAKLPPRAQQDVIRTAFIYDPSTVGLIGPSKVLLGDPAFANAREPLAQVFKAEGAPRSTAFGVIVNHFKSKGSGEDDGTGQGDANPDRVAQARALAAFAGDFKADRDVTKLFLTGDYNAYSMEDPVQELEGRGYTNLRSDQPDEWSYSFDGMSGSLDHVFANEAALADVTGVDIWNINADESVAFEYSRHNYNVTDFYRADQFRASDHDPEIIGIDVPGFSR